ncbi:MAG: hypothetical protein OXG97_13855 [Candidatus Poribacteria bacterium]|nr:hypothetical protein [Candidatus Poribacteria bacterium]
MIQGGIVSGYYGSSASVAFVYLKGRTNIGNPITIGTLKNQDDRFMGGGVHHPFVTKGQAYAIGFSGQIDEHEFGGNSIPLIFTDIVDETNSDITAVANTQRTENEVIQFPDGLYNIDLHFDITLQGEAETRTLEVQLRQIMENTDDVIVDFAPGQGGYGAGNGDITVDFRFDYWRPKRNAKYYFAVVAKREAYRLKDWRTRGLEGFLQIVKQD